MKFQEIINQDRPVLVDFYADWCGPCKIQSPILHELKDKMGEEISVIKIDVDKNQNLAARFQIRSIPTLMIFKNGESVWRKSGVAQLNELEVVMNQNK